MVMMVEQSGPGRRDSAVTQSPKSEPLDVSCSDCLFDDLHPRKTHSVTSRIDMFEASSFMDDANTQLEILHRQVFVLAKQSRARSAVPWKSIQRSRVQKATIAEMKDDASLARFDIDITGRHVKALTGRRPGTNRRQIADLMHRLKDADAIGVYARRQGLRIVAEIDEQIVELSEKIEKRMVMVDHDDRMPRSKASKRRAQYLALLDDRLDKSRRWNNDLRTQNAALRQDIDDLNLERRTDQAILAQLGKSVVGQRTGIRALLDGIHQAELAQAASLAETGPLQAQYRAESQVFAGDWARTVELDERHRALEEEIIRMKGEMYFGEGDKTTSDESIQLIMSRTAWRIAKDKALLSAVSVRHQQLRDLIDELQRLTSTTSIDDIVARFERADCDQLAQYAALQSLIVELADLQRDTVVASSWEPGDPPDPIPIVVADPGQRCQELGEDAAELRDVFTKMTVMIVDMLEMLKAANVSICSEAIRERLMTVGVTAQNVEDMVSGLDVDVGRLLDRLGIIQNSDIWRDPNIIDDNVSIILPSLHQDDDELDIR